ncbi:MAG TPA: stage V sporulation protein AD [Candidatus Coproplasma avistercoris]|nr:stage V sporulation protein AD [Candidatus Coproplasma avistercoris]
MKRGNTIFFGNAPRVRSYAAICGSKEREGVAGRYADIALSDDMYGESTYEKAECKMLSNAVSLAVEKGRLTDGDVDALLSGDLLNQIISASFAARDFQFPYLGLYSACSTMSEGMLLAAALVDGGYARNCVAATGSHFASAERQYRYPLELGCTRPPQSQWTVTGAGACVISADCGRIKLLNATLGRVRDWGVTDVNNMGAAMAPAAADTVMRHFRDTDTLPEDYDAIITGDLGALGSRIFKDLLWEKGFDVANHVDCGEMIYKVVEDEFQGGSGAGCSAVIMNSYVFAKMEAGLYNRVLFAATGALLSTVSSGQGESIPCISHAVELEAGHEG